MDKLTNNLRNLQAGFYSDGALDKPILLVAADRIESLEAQLKVIKDEIAAHKRTRQGDDDYLGNKNLASDLRLWALLSPPITEKDNG